MITDRKWKMVRERMEHLGILKRKRSKRAKERMLRDKKAQSEKKKLRMDPDS